MENERGELVDLYVHSLHRPSPLSMPGRGNRKANIHTVTSQENALPPTASSRSALPLDPFRAARSLNLTIFIDQAKDHASVQISVAKVDENGRSTGEAQTYALCGFVRAMGESDDSFNRLAQRDGFLKGVWSASR